MEWAGVVIGRFGNKFSLIYSREDTGEVDPNDLLPTDIIFDILGCGGKLHCRLPNTKSSTLFSRPGEFSFLSEI